MAEDFSKGSCTWRLDDGVWILTDQCNPGCKCREVQGKEIAPTNSPLGLTFTQAQFDIFLRQEGIPALASGVTEVKIGCVDAE